MKRKPDNRRDEHPGRTAAMARIMRRKTDGVHGKAHKKYMMGTQQGAGMADKMKRAKKRK